MSTVNEVQRTRMNGSGKCRIEGRRCSEGRSIPQSAGAERATECGVEGEIMKSRTVIVPIMRSSRNAVRSRRRARRRNAKSVRVTARMQRFENGPAPNERHRSLPWKSSPGVISTPHVRIAQNEQTVNARDAGSVQTSNKAFTSRPEQEMSRKIECSGRQRCGRCNHVARASH